jgi:hypothetical protein
MSLGEMKKNALLEVFKEVVRAEVRQDTGRAQRALDQAATLGLNRADVEWVCGLDGKEFRKVFGDNALGLDLEERMEDHDNTLKAFQFSPRFESFYRK